nr:reverse transcriptase-like protein [uncultured Sphingosinicella sp.]
MKIFFDGGCRPNPGEMEVAVVARGRLYHRTGLGLGSSDEAEWLALLHGLEVARDLGVKEVVLLGDSAAVINRVNGSTKPGSASAGAMLAKYRKEALFFTKLRVRHVRRTQNLAGIALGRIREAARGSAGQR